MNSQLNFFVPYERAAAWHENQLTRALLVVLRYSPMAHQVWLAMITSGTSLHDLPAAAFATQRQLVVAADVEVPAGEAIRGISVWLAPDAAQVSEVIKPSERQQVLDGVITYGTALVVVIENKITMGNVTEQPHHINLHGAPIEFDPTPRSVSWQQLLGAFADLVERELVSGAERLLIGDFLDFVEKNFPHIGPFSTLSRCNTQPFRVARRLDSVLGAAVGTEVGTDLGWRNLVGTRKVTMAKLSFVSETSSVYLQMYPGDTLGQAREFYSDFAAVDAVLALQADHWRIQPNFHWGYMTSGLAWMASTLPVGEYCSYWIANIGSSHQLNRAEWETYWVTLVANRIVDATEKSTFDAEFTARQRQNAQPRPGLSCEYIWPLAEAKKLDAGGKFEESV